jgi:hypothetical protein
MANHQEFGNSEMGLGMAIVCKSGSRYGATTIEYAVLIGLALLGVSTAIMLAGQWTARAGGPAERQAFAEEQVFSVPQPAEFPGQPAKLP